MLYKHDNAAKRYLGDYWGCGGGGGGGGLCNTWISGLGSSTVLVLKYIFISTDVLEYLVYGNVKVLVLDQKVLEYYLSVKWLII